MSSFDPVGSAAAKPATRRRRAPLLLAGALAVAAAGYGAWTTTLKPAPTFSDQPVATVERGPLRISVLERGNLRAKNSVKVRCELEGQSTILFLVPEGKSVVAGELICELDVSNQSERRVQQEIAYKSAEASLAEAKEKLEIQRNQNESNITKGTLNVEFAETELKKYVEGDFPQAKDTIQNQIKIAEAELQRAKGRFEWSQTLASKKFLTGSELEVDELAFKRGAIDLKLAERKLAVLTTYEGPMRIRKLEADRDEVKRELERVKRRAAAEIKNAEAQYSARQSTHNLERERLEKLDDQLRKAKIVAPRDGMVVYASPGGGGWRGRDQPIAVGSTVNERQEIIELPDTSSMLAELRIHESSMDRVSMEQTAVVTVDAFPELQFAAKVTYLGVVPDSQQSWLNPDLRVYRAEVELSGDTRDLRPQMSCSVEVLVEDFKQATFVPVQSIFRRGGRPVAYVVDGSRVVPRVVEPGLTNDRHVQVLQGLREGERVLMSLPPGLGSEVTVETPRTRVGEVVQAVEPSALPPKAMRPAADAGASERRPKGGGNGDRGDRNDRGGAPGRGKSPEGKTSEGASGETKSEGGAPVASGVETAPPPPPAAASVLPAAVGLPAPAEKPAPVTVVPQSAGDAVTAERAKG